jgi:hypothetical protein
MLVKHLLDQLCFGISFVTVDDTGRRRAVDEREHVAELEVGERAAWAWAWVISFSCPGPPISLTGLLKAS